MRKRTKTDKREATAYHEAGHAVAAFFRGRPFQFVTIKPGSSWISIGLLSNLLRESYFVERHSRGASSMICSPSG